MTEGLIGREPARASRGRSGLCAAKARLSASAALAPIAMLALWPSSEALAACTPSAGDNVTATCTGTTTDQNPPNGYGNGVENNVDVSVVPGASVTGSSSGITFSTGSVANSGSIAGTDGGVSANVVTVTNSGSIIGGAAGDGISADSTNVTNSGIITGGSDGIIANTRIDVTNSGTISGVTGDGINAFFAGTIVNVTNFGTITGGDTGIGSDRATIENSGSITGGISGIEATTANVTNSGTIQGNLTGMFVDKATITNSGTIKGNTFGIQATSAISVINSGSIIGDDAINAPTANVINSGTISGASFGINANIADVTNYGTIAGGGVGDGIESNIANVINYGTIAGGNAEGIEINTGTVTNYGTISGSFGIEADVSGNVTNAGTIVGTAGPAIQFSGNPDTLTLLPGSTIIGVINLGGGGDTVNFHGGNHNLRFDTLTGATVTGTTPFVVSGNRAAAIDVTPFALEDRAVMDFSRAVSSAIPDIEAVGATKTASVDAGASSAMAFARSGDNESLIAGDFASIPGLSAYDKTSMLPFKAPTAVYGNGAALWARGFAGERVQDADGPLLHADDRFFGGMIGAGWQALPNLRVGGFLGAGETKSSIDPIYGGVKSTLVFGGLFARYASGNSFLKAVLQGGYSSNDSTRNINNNLAPGGIETAKASYDGWYIDPEATFGHHFVLGAYAGGLYTLTPSLTVRFLHAGFGGYTETGSTANLSVGSHSADDFEERGEFKLARTQSLASGATLVTNLFGGVLADERSGDAVIDATLLGQAIPFAVPGDDNVWGGFVGGGLEWRSGRFALYAQADYLALSDQSSVIAGQAGLRVMF